MTGPEFKSIEERNQHILDMCGIRPDAEYHTPVENTRDLIRGVQDGDPVAKASLIATRIAWVHDRYAQNPEVEERFDIDLEDVMQTGCLAILEAASQMDLDSNDASTLLHVRTSARMTGHLIQGKLIPGFTERGNKVVGAGSSDDIDRISEQIVPVGGADEVAALAHEDRSGVVESIEAAAERDIAIEAISDALQEELDDRSRQVVEARFGLGEMEPFERERPRLRQLGESIGLSAERVRQIELRALHKLKGVFKEHGVVSLLGYEDKKQERESQLEAARLLIALSDGLKAALRYFEEEDNRED